MLIDLADATERGSEFQAVFGIDIYFINAFVFAYFSRLLVE